MRARVRLPVVAAAGPALRCPSAPADMPGAEAFGVVDHTVEPPLVGFLDQPAPATAELVALAAPLRPTEVFRFAAPCQGETCAHWSGAACHLVDRIVEGLAPAVTSLPACRVRHDCRWFAQRGRDACLRCPQVVTQNEHPSDAMRDAAEPA